MNKPTRVASIYAMLAGACDGITGILLLAAPLPTLKLMGIGVVPTEPVYMQWIGAFVFSVGFSYFLPFLSRNVAAKRRRFTSLFETTAFIRVVIALFTGIAIARGSLDMTWITVTATDATLAATQLILLKLGAFQSDE